ncbi:MAG: NfeD family protein [Oscillospiraceae bacterium]
MNIALMLLWAILTVLLVIIEFATVSFVAIWFALGALIAFIVSFFVNSFALQLLVFVFVSLLFLLCTRRLVKKFLNKAYVATNIDSILGKTCIVLEKIDNTANVGRATAENLNWNARSRNDAITFEPGEIAVIVAIEGVKLIVEKQVK